MGLLGHRWAVLIPKHMYAMWYVCVTQFMSNSVISHSWSRIVNHGGHSERDNGYYHHWHHMYDDGRFRDFKYNQGPSFCFLI